MQELTGETLFETGRVRCRRWRAEDVELIYQLYSQTDVVRWVGDGEPLGRSDAKRWLTVTADNYAQRGYGMFALVERDTGLFIGCAGLVHPGQQAEAEIKYALRPAWWGQGIATELVAALLDWGVQQHGLESVIATVAPANLGSQRVLQKAGMTLKAIRRDDAGGEADSTATYPETELTAVYEWRASN